MVSKKTIIMGALVVVALAALGYTGVFAFNQYSVKRCEACGMEVTSEIQSHIKITDGNGAAHYACCQGCMFRLLDPVKGSPTLHIETYCDYYGPNYRIVIDASKNGNVTVCQPATASVLLGTKIVASCANNRIAYNQTAANALVAQGYSQYTMKWQQQALPAGTPVMSVPAVAVAMAKKGMAYTAPSALVPGIVGAVGVFTLLGAVVAYKKLGVD